MNDSNRVLDVVVIGGGQAGLATGWQLQQQGLEYLILDEQTSPGGNWRNYYESLQLFSPAEYSALPGRAFPGDPKGYPLRDDVVQYLEAYAAEFQLPFQGGTRVVAVVQKDKAFEVRTANGATFTARAVIVASGASAVLSCLTSLGWRTFQDTVCIAQLIEHLRPLPASVLSLWEQRTRLFRLPMSLPALHR